MGWTLTRRLSKYITGKRRSLSADFSESERVHDAQALGAGKYLKKLYVVEKLGLAVKKEMDRAT